MGKQSVRTTHKSRDLLMLLGHIEALGHFWPLAFTDDDQPGKQTLLLRIFLFL